MEKNCVWDEPHWDEPYCVEGTYLAVSLDDVQLVELAGERLVDAAEEEVLFHLPKPLCRTLPFLLAHQEVHL